VNVTQAYRLLALSPIDPIPQSWRWQKARFIARVLLRKLLLRCGHRGVL